MKQKALLNIFKGLSIKQITYFFGKWESDFKYNIIFKKGFQKSFVNI